MVSTALPPAAKADKALASQIAQFDEALDNATDFIELMKENAGKAPLQKDMADQRKRMKAALEGTDKRVMDKAVTVLIKDATKLLDAASYAARMEVFRKYEALWGKARGLLAQALIEVGAIEPLALRAPLQKEQAGLRAELDRIEKSIDYAANIDAIEEMLPRIDALLKRLGSAGDAGKWMGATYAPLLARVRAALKRVPGDRCRKSLLAELEFIEVDTNKALAKADQKSVQALAVPKLQHIEKLAARIVAVSPALDRELARLAKLAASSANGAMKAKLKALVQVKAASWPAGADADDIEKALATFESDLATLTQQFDKAAAEKAPAKA